MLGGYCLGPARSLNGTPVNHAAMVVCALAALDCGSGDVAALSGGDGQPDSDSVVDSKGDDGGAGHAVATAATGVSAGCYEADVRVYHTPITMAMPVHQLLKMVMRSPRLHGRCMRIIPHGEWLGLVSGLKETNPMFAFADSFRNGMGGATAHLHAHTTALLRTSGGSNRTTPSEIDTCTVEGGGDGGTVANSPSDGGTVAKAVLTKRPYTQDEVDRVVSFILSQCDL